MGMGVVKPSMEMRLRWPSCSVHVPKTTIKGALSTCMLEPWIGTGVMEPSMGMRPRDVSTYLGYM